MQSSLNIIFREAKIRLAWTFFSILLTCSYSYWYSEYLLFVLTRPFLRVSQPNSIFLCTQLTESLNTYITTSIILGIFFSTPYIFYQIWCFLIPSCNVTQRIQVSKLCILSGFAFIFFFLFTYALLMPNIWSFLYKLNFAHTNSQSLLLIKLEPKIYDFIVLTLRFFFIASFCSQLPVVIICCIEYNLLSVQDCIRHRKTFLLFSALLAALITPPDIWCQIAAWIPIYAIFEFTIFTALIQNEYNNSI
jgi:Tat protein translocase TatC